MDALEAEPDLDLVLEVLLDRPHAHPEFVGGVDGLRVGGGQLCSARSTVLDDTAHLPCRATLCLLELVAVDGCAAVER